MGLQLVSFAGSRLRQLVALPLVALLAGCFSMQPVDRAAPAIGAEVAVDLNDAGRTALGSKLGPQVAQVHGHLLRRDGDGDLLALTSAEFLRGGSQTWAGETVHVRSDYASQYYENRVSTSRSVVVGGLAVGALAIMAVEALKTPASQGSDGTLEQPGNKLRARPRGSLRFSTSAVDATRAARVLIPLLRLH
jgi:hypothetical protein